jgi:lysophospholipase L1-like esterase
MVRVLCFGDSLTEGFTFQEGREFHPYSIALRRHLQDHGHGSAEVDTAGVSGECVVPSMPCRLDRILNEAAQPYDWVIILGGTNDICSGLRAEDILPSLLGLHDSAKTNGSTRTLALALPQFLDELTPGDEDGQKREKAKLNEGLKQMLRAIQSALFPLGLSLLKLMQQQRPAVAVVALQASIVLRTLL